MGGCKLKRKGTSEAGGIPTREGVKSQQPMCMSFWAAVTKHHKLGA